MSQVSNSSRQTVLLVEDHPPEREKLRKYLVEAGFTVVLATDYRSAVAALEELIPDLICVELTLPSESGYELCEYIRRDVALKRVPVLVMSDRTSPEDMAYAENVGANAFLKKPFERDKLLKYVIAMLDGAAAGSRPSVRRLRPSDGPPRS